MFCFIKSIFVKLLPSFFLNENKSIETAYFEELLAGTIDPTIDKLT